MAKKKNKKKNKESKFEIQHIIGAVLGGILGGLFALYGLCCLGEAITGVGNVKLYTGKLKIVSPATENTLGLTGMGPMIVRDTQMYQYVSKDESYYSDGEENTYDLAVMEFSSYHVEDFSAYPSEKEAKKLFGREQKYSNPPFPKEFANKKGNGHSEFYGEVEIGDKGIKLDKSLLKCFNGDSYSMKDCTRPAYITPEDAGAEYGLTFVGDGTYVSRTEGDWQIGDLKVSYRVVEQDILADEFTAVGILSEDKVLSRGDTGALYNRKVSLDEVTHDYRMDQLKTGLLFILGGIAIFGLIMAIAIFIV